MFEPKLLSHAMINVICFHLYLMEAFESRHTNCVFLISLLYQLTVMSPLKDSPNQKIFMNQFVYQYEG